MSIDSSMQSKSAPIPTASTVSAGKAPKGEHRGSHAADDQLIAQKLAEEHAVLLLLINHHSNPQANSPVANEIQPKLIALEGLNAQVYSYVGSIDPKASGKLQNADQQMYGMISDALSGTSRGKKIPDTAFQQITDALKEGPSRLNKFSKRG